MILTKITPGFVSQRYDTETGEWLDQEFVAGTHVDWEDEYGEAIDPCKMEGDEPYLRFEMKQPGEME